MGECFSYKEEKKVRFLLGLPVNGSVAELAYAVGLDPMCYEGSNPSIATREFYTAC